LGALCAVSSSVLSHEIELVGETSGETRDRLSENSGVASPVINESEISTLSVVHINVVPSDCSSWKLGIG